MRSTSTQTRILTRRAAPFRAVCLSLVLAALAGLEGLRLQAASPSDIRRDATVKAIEQAMPAVVNVATETIVEAQDPVSRMFREFFEPYYRRRPNAMHSLGSGAVIDERGYVLTNFHVIQRASQIRVTLSDGREFAADPIAATIQRDLALIKLRSGPDETFSAIRLADDDDLLLGETVLALGNPFGLGESVSRGILSSKARRPVIEDEPMDVADWLQTDAAINPGNSGGPLINLRGELIGVNVAVFREGQGIGFAVPVKRVSEALAELFSPEVIEGLWFGAKIGKKDQRLEIVEVEKDSPAASAGLRVGDRILQVNGQDTQSALLFHQRLMAADRDQGAPIVVDRDGKRLAVLVRLVPEADHFNAEIPRRRLGLTLQELTAELAESLGLRSVEGVIISDVEPRSPADRAGIEHGMVLRTLDRQVIPDVVTAARILDAKKKGDSVRLGLIIQRRMGNGFVQLVSTAARLTVR